MAEKLYRSYSLEKSAYSTSGSISIWEDSPVSPFDIGDSFTPITNGPALTVEKVSIKDNVIGELNGKPLRQWEIIIEGSNSTSESSATHIKYNFSISEGEKSGSMEVVNTGDTPFIALNVGDTFSIPGIGEVFCSSVKGNDAYDEAGVHSWSIIYEGSNKTVIQEADVKYSLNIEHNSDGLTVYSGSKEFTCSGTAPAVDLHIGDTFTLPLIGVLTCTRISSSNIDANSWSVVIEGSRGGSASGGDDDDTSLPDNDTVITREINGSTVRTVTGEFIALRRSLSPIVKKTITVYSSTLDPIATPGNFYQGGIVLSENITKETIKNNGVVTSSYYKHTLEIEA